MFKATRLQVATYLFGVCPFSIAFLVFLNSSVSFVITDLIGREHGVGDAVGTLGFADELLALVACPLWGVLSDRMGLHFVCVCGYLIICLALSLFVQARNVYPQLLLARLLFSLGGAAATTMVTAILPAVAASTTEPNEESGRSRVVQALGSGHISSPSIASESTITPARFMSRSFTRQDNRTRTLAAPVPDPDIASSTSRIAGLVGMFTGCGALIALTIFLPLPARFQYSGIGERDALKYSFYIVAVVAFLLAIWCFFGLRNIQAQPEDSQSKHSDPVEEGRHPSLLGPLHDMFGNFTTAIRIGFRRSEIAIGYVGGFVARASSVAISLFIPLLVNAMFLSSDLCNNQDSRKDPTGLPDIKRRCPQAYIVAAELTGVSQMVALIFAPIFGYWTAKSSRKELPLLVASLSGVVGYPLFAGQFDPDGSKTTQRVAAFFAVCLIGISQIGAIVCSLGTLSKGILIDTPQTAASASGAGLHSHDGEAAENQPLLRSGHTSKKDAPLSTIKGSIAGVYSLYGGAAILILTKIGGLMFDKVSLAAPFYIMAIFNAILMCVCATLTLWKPKTREQANRVD